MSTVFGAATATRLKIRQAKRELPSHPEWLAQCPAGTAVADAQTALTQAQNDRQTCLDLFQDLQEQSGLTLTEDESGSGAGTVDWNAICQAVIKYAPQLIALIVGLFPPKPPV